MLFCSIHNIFYFSLEDNTTAFGYKRTQFEETKEWSAIDDRKLINAVAETVGDWAAVAEMFRDGVDNCLSPLQCLARFISLPAVAPANDAAAGTALYTALLPTEMAAEMATALGCDAAQEIVKRVISSSEVRLFVTNRPSHALTTGFAIDPKMVSYITFIGRSPRSKADQD